MDLAKTYGSDTESDLGVEQLNELVIQGYSPVGTVTGGYGSAQVEAREVVIPASQTVMQAVRVEVTSGGEYPQTAFASVSYGNVSKFIAALEKLQFTEIKRDRFSFTEVQFELDDLKVIVFNNDRGTLMWALSSSNVSIHFSSLSTITKLKELFEEAKAHLDRTKI